MTDAMLDLADLSLWEEGFPDHVFAELRSTAPVYHQQLTVAVDDRVGRGVLGLHQTCRGIAGASRL